MTRLFRFNEKQEGWVAEWVEIFNATRQSKAIWIMVHPKSSAPGLRSLDLHYAVPSKIEQIDQCLNQYAKQILGEEFIDHPAVRRSLLEKHYGRYDIKINTKKGMFKFLDAMRDRDYYYCLTGFVASSNLKEPNLANGYDVMVGSSSVKIWRHEFTIPSEESFGMFTEESHDFIPIKGNKLSESMKLLIEGTELKFVYEHALLDGANEVQAIATAYGQDISMVPHLNGYFKCRDEYRNVFVR